MARYKGIGMPKAKKARVEQAEKIEFEQIEDAIEEEAVGSEREAEQEQQPRAPRRMLHRQQLLQQHLLITMLAASPFRRPGQPKTCLFGSNMVRCRAQRRGQRTLGRFHDFSRSLSGVGGS